MRRSLYATWSSEEATVHNIKNFSQILSQENPAAICQLKKEGNTDDDHFKSDIYIPNYTLLAEQAQVQLHGTKYENPWGLYDGARGFVDAIVYSFGSDPNKGDLPAYVVVHFPNYSGPIWDKNNPKVSFPF